MAYPHVKDMTDAELAHELEELQDIMGGAPHLDARFNSISAEIKRRKYKSSNHTIQDQEAQRCMKEIHGVDRPDSDVVVKVDSQKCIQNRKIGASRIKKASSGGSLLGGAIAAVVLMLAGVDWRLCALIGIFGWVAGTAAQIREELVSESEARSKKPKPGNQLTEAGTEFHVRGFEQMSPESQKALETIVDAAAKEMEEED